MDQRRDEQIPATNGTSAAVPSGVRAVAPAAEVVKPTDAGVAAAFGPGFRLARVTLGMVPKGVWPFNLVGLSGTPVTRGIEGKVAWIGDYPKETTFERRLRETGGGGGGSLMPGMNLRRN